MLTVWISTFALPGLSTYGHISLSSQLFLETNTAEQKVFRPFHFGTFWYFPQTLHILIPKKHKKNGKTIHNVVQLNVVVRLLATRWQHYTDLYSLFWQNRQVKNPTGTSGSI